MKNTNLSFFERKLTKQEWENPNILRFHNHEIPIDEIDLIEGLNDMILEFKNRYANDIDDSSIAIA